MLKRVSKPTEEQILKMKTYNVFGWKLNQRKVKHFGLETSTGHPIHLFSGMKILKPVLKIY